MRVNVDLAEIAAALEEANVPLALTDGVTEIYFTILCNENVGNYSKGVISISYCRVGRKLAWKTLVHELAHHIDESEGISDGPEFIQEFRSRSHLLVDDYARELPREYLAVGFETFYFGMKWERRRMRKRNPLLWRTISSIHRRLRSR